METPQEHMQCQLPALELADAFLEHTGDLDDPHESVRVRNAILCAGQHLADEGYPGCWTAFHPERFFAQMSFQGDHELVGTALILIGLFGWLALNGVLPDTTALKLMLGTREHAPESALLAELCRSAQRIFGRGRSN